MYAFSALFQFLLYTAFPTYHVSRKALFLQHSFPCRALRTTNKLTQNPSVGSLYSIETIMLMVNYALRKQMMIINDKLKAWCFMCFTNCVFIVTVSQLLKFFFDR